MAAADAGCLAQSCHSPALLLGLVFFQSLSFIMRGGLGTCFSRVIQTFPFKTAVLTPSQLTVLFPGSACSKRLVAQSHSESQPGQRGHKHVVGGQKINK